jgi:hypothetical protein
MTVQTRYFLTYRGIKLPLQLTDELDEASVQNRGTYFRATYDDLGNMTRIEKLVYGDVELEHVYRYDAAGKLSEASIATPGEEPRLVKLPT